MTNLIQMRRIFGGPSVYHKYLPGSQRVQGYLVHETPPPRRTLQWPYAQGPVVVLGRWVFLMSEVPLYHLAATWTAALKVFQKIPYFRVTQ